MPCRLLHYRSAQDGISLRDMLAGRDDPGNSVEPAVRDILAAVASDGDAALIEYTRRFDCPDFSADMLRVTPESLARAAEEVPATDLSIILEAAQNIREFHERQKQNSWFTTRPDGTVLGQMIRPVDRVGLYVPGGQGGNTPLISSMLMNAIPAQVAGVPSIAVVSPPRRDGTPNPYILAAAHALGLNEVYACGSAWAVAALAYGTGTIAPVDVIAGPGNIFVATAKRMLIGKVGIDMIAGPSEILILADKTARPEHIAADMLSQAEHDALASAILVTDHPPLADAVLAALDAQMATLPRADIARKALSDWGAVVVADSMELAMELSNAIAPEHLEIMTADPWSTLPAIRNAGAIFLGTHSPEPVGDYFAGPNHVLPTNGTARFSSALSVDTFTKKSSIIAASAAFTQHSAGKIARLARLEGLEAHARSAESRSNKQHQE